MSYSITTRIQYTFEVSNRQLACLLTKNTVSNINLVGISIIEERGRFCKKLVNIVVGTVNPTDVTNNEQNEQFKANLCQLCIKFRESCIIQIFNVEATSITPLSSYRIPYVNLVCAGIDIIASYLGIPNTGQVVSTFFQVPSSQLQKAINVLNSIDVMNPDVNLCININNVNCICDCKCNNQNCCNN